MNLQNDHAGKSVDRAIFRRQSSPTLALVNHLRMSGYFLALPTYRQQHNHRFEPLKPVFELKCATSSAQKPLGLEAIGKPIGCTRIKSMLLTLTTSSKHIDGRVPLALTTSSKHPSRRCRPRQAIASEIVCSLIYIYIYIYIHIHMYMCVYVCVKTNIYIYI